MTAFGEALARKYRTTDDVLVKLFPEMAEDERMALTFKTPLDAAQHYFPKFSPNQIRSAFRTDPGRGLAQDAMPRQMRGRARDQNEEDPEMLAIARACEMLEEEGHGEAADALRQRYGLDRGMRRADDDEERLETHDPAYGGPVKASQSIEQDAGFRRTRARIRREAEDAARRAYAADAASAWAGISARFPTIEWRQSDGRRDPETWRF